MVAGGGAPMQPGMNTPGSSANKLKSFDNTSASSTASSGVGTSISSLNTTNSSLNSSVGGGPPAPPSVVKKYMEQKYGNNPQQQQLGMNNPNVNSSSPSTSLFNSFLSPDKNGMPKNSLGSGLLNQLTGNNNNNNNSNQNMANNPNMQNNDNPLGAGLSSFTSKFSSGLDSLKLSATNSLTANKLTSKFMNPFSSN